MLFVCSLPGVPDYRGPGGQRQQEHQLIPHEEHPGDSRGEIGFSYSVKFSNPFHSGGPRRRKSWH